MHTNILFSVQLKVRVFLVYYVNDDVHVTFVDNNSAILIWLLKVKTHWWCFFYNVYKDVCIHRTVCLFNALKFLCAFTSHHWLHDIQVATCSLKAGCEWYAPRGSCQQNTFFMVTIHNMTRAGPVSLGSDWTEMYPLFSSWATTLSVLCFFSDLICQHRLAGLQWQWPYI